MGVTGGGDREGGGGSPRRNPLVLGIGNLLMGDEGVGSHAALRLREEPLPEGVEVVDGGTGGFQLLSLFGEHDPIVLIDGTMDGRPAGTVTVLRPRFASDFPRTLAAHDIGLRDLIETAALLGPLPEMYLIAVSVGAAPSPGLRLSVEVAHALDQVVERVREILRPAGQSSGTLPL